MEGELEAQAAAQPEVQPLVELVAAATALFYLAEHEENPAVASYWDAFHYIATCVSVGYANLFPVTPLGKLIGGVVMLVGPKMSSELKLGPSPASGTTDRSLSPAP